MDDYREKRKAEILEILKETVISRLPRPEIRESAVPSLYLIRHDEPLISQHCMSEPMIALQLQGRKDMRVGRREYGLDPGQILAVCVESPSSSYILDASRARPFLAVKFALDVKILTDLIAEMPRETWPQGEKEFPIHIMDASLEFLETLSRLVMLIHHPERIAILAPLILRELHYLLLIGPQGALLQDLYMRGAKDNRIIDAIAILKKYLNRSIPIETLARKVNMSVSSLHRQFKRVTGVSPLQYHKKLRLCEAQRRMLAENERADIAALSVGYESITQFNREYKRLFGEPPLRDIRARKRKMKGDS
ncbi:MAG: AraC family transcriptional regulator [Desulfovibrio sp.]|nr:AraC family transcriptional regulator [Desulfovibrio sp.]